MKCRIGHIQPPCEYQADGILDIRLLDYDDFAGVRFRDGEKYSNCFVSVVLRKGEFVKLEATDNAKYYSSLQNGVHSHTIETFVCDLSSDVQAQLQLASKRRYLVMFKIRSGKWFIFGFEAGASVVFNNQTSEGIGTAVRVSTESMYPLFESAGPEAKWECFSVWSDFVNIGERECWNDFGADFNRDFNCNIPGVYCEWSDFINIWVRGGDFGTDYNMDFN